MKIQVFTNRLEIDYKRDFDKAKEYFKGKGLDIEFSFEETNLKNLRWYKVQLPQGERILLYPVNLLLPKHDSDITIFAFNGKEFKVPNIPTGKCYMAEKPYIDVSTHINNPKNLTYVEICHEIMHGLVYLANSNGFFVRDVMDTYLENFTPNSPTGNFAQQFALLEPFLKPAVVLTRIEDTGKQTLGELRFKNFSCKTLERPDKNNLPNISCIPKGTYNAKYTFSPKFMKYTYEVQNVSKRSGIRIHSGNFFYQIQGCILLGSSFKDINSDGQKEVLESRITISKFESLLGKKDFTLIIK